MPTDLEEIRIRRITWKQYEVWCDGKWVTINKGDVGFGELQHYYVVFKAAHGVACGSKRTK